MHFSFIVLSAVMICSLLGVPDAQSAVIVDINHPRASASEDIPSAMHDPDIGIDYENVEILPYDVSSSSSNGNSDNSDSDSSNLLLGVLL